nr:unnamed protein product [Spirometra erinaceieuropaei]
MDHLTALFQEMLRQGEVPRVSRTPQSCTSISRKGLLPERHRIRVAYRTYGQLLNHRRIHFQSPFSTTTVHKPLFADVCALNATTEGDMQRSMCLFSAACINFSLVIRTEYTVFMHQPPPKTSQNALQISVNGNQLQVVDNFTYLGSTASRSTKIYDEAARRTSKAT